MNVRPEREGAPIVISGPRPMAMVDGNGTDALDTATLAYDAAGEASAYGRIRFDD